MGAEEFINTLARWLLWLIKPKGVRDSIFAPHLAAFGASADFCCPIPPFHPAMIRVHFGVSLVNGWSMAAVALHEPITRMKSLGVALGVSGAGLLILRAHSGGSGNHDLLGILLAFLSVCGYSLYLLITRSVSQRYAPVTLMRWLFLFTAMMLLPFGASDLPVQRIYTSEATWQAIELLTYIVICSTAIRYFLMPVALKRLRATTVSIYMNLQPIVAAIAAIAIGQDTFTWDKPIAAALVIAGAYVVTRSPSKQCRASQ